SRTHAGGSTLAYQQGRVGPLFDERARVAIQRVAGPAASARTMSALTAGSARSSRSAGTPIVRLRAADGYRPARSPGPAKASVSPVATVVGDERRALEARGRLDDEHTQAGAATTAARSRRAATTTPASATPAAA